MEIDFWNKMIKTQKLISVLATWVVQSNIDVAMNAGILQFYYQNTENGVISMLKSKLLKKTLCMTIAFILVMSLSMNVFAVTVTQTKTVNDADYVTIYCSYNNMYNDIANYWVSSTKYYSDYEGYTGYLDYQGYNLVSYNGVAANTVECQVAYYYSGTVTRTLNYPDSKVVQTNVLYLVNASYDVASYMRYYEGTSINYNDEHYSGTLYYSGYSIVDTRVDAFYSYFVVQARYSGTVYFHY